MNIAAYQVNTTEDTGKSPATGAGIVNIVVNGLIRWSDRRIALRRFSRPSCRAPVGIAPKSIPSYKQDGSAPSGCFSQPES